MVPVGSAVAASADAGKAKAAAATRIAPRRNEVRCIDILSAARLSQAN
jgi:hypothetical protein